MVTVLAKLCRGFMDYRLWLFAVIYAGLSLSLAVISIFLPSLLSVMGFAGYKSNLMTVPPYAVSSFSPGSREESISAVSSSLWRPQSAESVTSSLVLSRGRPSGTLALSSS
jgi:hypothetical protein